MKYGYLTQNHSNCLIQNVSRTTHFLERFFGLLFAPPIKHNEALLIAPCASVHTFGMRYAIDVIFLDNDWKIVKMVKELKPWRVAGAKTASMTLELAANRLDKLNLSNGQQLVWHDD